MADMLYNGKQLIWLPKGESIAYTFKATSGSPLYQSSLNQCVPDSSPIPEGVYSLSLVIDAKIAEVYTDKAGCHLRSSLKIQSIPRGFNAGECDKYLNLWGYNRVRLNPYDQKARNACSGTRGGFYLHDSKKGYTEGCVETETRFFTILRKYVNTTLEKKLTLEVKYAFQSTYGETDK